MDVACDYVAHAVVRGVWSANFSIIEQTFLDVCFV